MLNTINPQNLVLSHEQWLALSPFLVMTGGILLSMILATIHFGKGKYHKFPLFLLTTLTLAASSACVAFHWVREPMQIFGGMMVLDYFSSFFILLIGVAAIIVLFSSYSYLDESEIHYSEFYPLLLVATLGMMLLAGAAELLTIFVALELMSITVYVLVGMRRMNALNNEASVKYFVMGGVAAAVYLYGTALIYGALNTTKLAQISTILSQNGTDVLSNPILLTGVALLMAGFLFKVAAAPFHMWTPDVYEGAPSNITSYMATALKASVFAVLVRVCVSVFGDQGVAHFGNLQHLVHQIIWWIALLTMVIGNFVALMQTNLKRLMAYSAIAHTGYLLIGLLAGPKVGYSGIVIYLVAYVAMNLGAFGVLGLIAGKDDHNLTTQNMAGFSKKHPVAAAALTLFLLSLGGFPPTVGFVGKYYMFSGALEAGETLLVLIAVLTSAVSVFYYLKIVVLMYMKDASDASGTTSFRSSKAAYVAIAICIFLTLNFGLFPAQLIHAVKKAAIF